MIQAVLYVCHGSRIRQACDEAVSFIRRVQPHIEADIQEICFLELAEPSIEEGFAACVRKGAGKIAVVPLLLLTAAHAKEDIPKEVKEAASLFPHVEVTYGKPIGVHEKLAESVLKRVTEQGNPGPDSLIVIVGRGSSDPDVARDLEEISLLVRDRAGGSEVDIAFVTAAKPSLDDMLDRVAGMNDKRIFLVPYLLFTGLVMREVMRKALSVPHKDLTVCRYLGYDSGVEEVFTERVQEAVSNRNGAFDFIYEGKTYASIND
ncbi:sirohydrochlorin chelatase [Metabacillus indicus]|uniref:Sirohydrochlorin ferrochelatase n=1 Tax=Metabacillus indicus TaxID=246786 RepID=A0A084H3M8_METID|nr:sirohydrochlorin chelatase [Metabacillus indicus]KEZ54190.1 hypothetical protein GS18_0204495 [Metabacillus indicus]